MLVDVDPEMIEERQHEFLDASRSEPIAISKTGRPYAVLISWQEYERLAALEDTLWVEWAREAEKEGYIGTKRAMKYIASRMKKGLLHK